MAKPSSLYKLSTGGSRGFTLIEILVVIALIALLSSMLIISIAKLRTNGKRQQTRLTMQNLQAMFAEYDRVAQQSFPTLDYSNITCATPCPRNVSLDYFNVINQSGTVPTALNAADRQGLAVQLTRDMMAKFISVPINAGGIGKLPAGSLMAFPAQPTPVAVYSSANSPYAPLSRVYFPTATGGTYACIETSQGSGTNVDIAPFNQIDPTFSYPTFTLPDNTGIAYVGYRWITSTATAATPVALDAWGNPIIFIYGGILENGKPLSVAGSLGGNLTFSGGRVVGGISIKVKSPDGRPFFASAGPDGDFSRGDDNLYSFEK